jgi:hypothetical protein
VYIPVPTEHPYFPSDSDPHAWENFPFGSGHGRCSQYLCHCLIMGSPLGQELGRWLLLLVREHMVWGLSIAHSSPECVRPYIRNISRKRKETEEKLTLEAWAGYFVLLCLFLLLVLHIAFLLFLLLALYLTSLALALLLGFLLLRFVVKQGLSMFACFRLQGLLLIGAVVSS